MTESTRLTTFVDTNIANFLTDRDPILTSIAAELAPFGEFSRNLLSGGKRFRAQFCYWGWRSVLGDDIRSTEQATGYGSGPGEREFEALVELCTALEFFHAAALVHDDIIDNSDTRRGMPAAHRSFERLHSAQGFSGDRAGYGRASAILMGDLLLAWSDELVGKALQALEPAAALATRQEFNRMRVEVTLGQYLDILEEGAWPVVPESDLLPRAERVIVYKSAKYSVEAPLVLGAKLHGASVDQVAALQAFGLPLGIAFQLRDDLLGVFGDAARTGKPSGDDLREGKRTVLVALARQTLSASSRRLFDELLGDPDLSPAQISMLQATITDSGAADRVETLIARHTDDALAALTAAPLAEPAKIELASLARVITQRDA
ncbi:polyprenyl synthetase family protein [Subtercola boreus]|uniref:Geranylgeranyl pyrophosphate synthase n=1 Tax=Subtercola boreus TaxID=120213 RepID=A0A3E0WAQ8_9MICO|nr:polyprenyl synthetase family protein [Subtercola boreus]RFA21086.1 geranylgeranyl pyrophosphate synthase [Subtercola boreus]RFA21470.1 geranylgeranyl pyrophosphate synthase [Subtercola boreus]RFA27441.1 geranylgeranyl pyrophosphate synthase [Subtercola boreus]